ncbi:MAG: SH3 domain-containing protein [Acidobacteria bacterium]|nr:SH3 domain-containing protein [Acidobacteriota bacterium]
MRDQLGTSSGTVTTLDGGEKVEVVAKRTRWVQVRVEDGRTGWVHSRFLAPQKVLDDFRRLGSEAAGLPSQGTATLRRVANLHLEPSTNADIFYQLAESDKMDVLAHRIIERDERLITSAATNGDTEAAEVAIKAHEDWFLVRAAAGKTGWLRENFLDISPPIEIARYNEGLRIRAWFELYREQHGNEVHPWYLWATIRPRPGLPFDFDEIRVFVWNPNKSRYETSYRERKLIGFYPIEVRSVETPSGPAPAFSLQVEDPSGKRYTKSYIMTGRLVRPAS